MGQWWSRSGAVGRTSAALVGLWHRAARFAKRARAFLALRDPVLAFTALLLLGLAAEAGAMVTVPLEFHLRSRPDDPWLGTVHAMAQDDRGRMWFGADPGLVRYDGNRYDHLSLPRPAERADVYWLQVDTAAQQLWVGSGQGLDVLDLKTNAWLPPDRERIPGVRRLAQGHQGQWWVQFLNDGLLRYDPKERRWQDTAMHATPQPDAREPEDAVSAMAPDGAGGVWLVVGSALRHLDREGMELGPARPLRTHPSTGVASTARKIRSLAMDKQGRVWVGAHGGIQIWQGPEGSLQDLPVPLPAPCNTDAVSAMLLEAQSGDMWLATTRGLCRWRAAAGVAEFLPVTDRETLVGHGYPMAALFQDRDHAVWAAGLNLGVAWVSLAPPQITRYLHDPTAPVAGTPTVAVLPLGAAQVMTGSYDGMLHLYDLDQGRSWQVGRERVPSGIKTALRLDARQVLIGTNGGGLVLPDLAKGRLKPHPAPALGHRTEAVNALAMDLAGDVWVGSGGGVHRLDAQGQWKDFPAGSGWQDAIGTEVVNAVLPLPDGTVMVAGRMGMRVWEPSQQKFVQAAGAAKVQGAALAQDREGAVWLGCDDGLYRVAREAGGWALKRWEPGPASQGLSARLSEVRALAGDRRAPCGSGGTAA